MSDKAMIVRGFAVVHRNEDDSLVAVWQVAFGDRQARSVNAVVIDLDDPEAEEIFASLTWREVLTVTKGSASPPFTEGPLHAVLDVCDAFIRGGESLGRWDDIPRPRGPREPKSGSPAHTALAAADHLVGSWNFWIRSSRKTRPDSPPPALPAEVLREVGLLDRPVELVGENR